MIPSKKVVLLACGSFNPPTNMHLRMFEIARDHLHRLGHYKVIGGIVSPVHDSYGKKELTSAAHRCAMLRLALHNSDWIKVSEWECNQDGWLPTRQVLQYHQNQLNAAMKSTETPKKRQKCQDNNENETDWVMNAVRHCSNNDTIHVKLLCGADLLESFGTPNLWQNDDIETIVGEHGLVVITRNECNPYKFIYESDLLTKHMNNIVIVTEWIKNEISSTKIRRALRRFESVKYLIADSVVDYIRNNMLYTPLDTKYQLIPNTDNMMGSIFLTPSPSDIVMTSPDIPVSNHLRIDVPDGSGKYISKRNDENIMRSKVKSVPGVAVQLVEEVGKVSKDVLDGDDDIPKVEIQITEDGTIQVISDKETTV